MRPLDFKSLAVAAVLGGLLIGAYAAYSGMTLKKALFLGAGFGAAIQIGVRLLGVS